ncbi:MAG TPA: YqzL family protein [Clostridia bacterium]|nr:YqzL family protein [Clostridia bacterium]
MGTNFVFSKDSVWTLFEKTGRIDAYMLYYDLTSSQTMTSQEASRDADKNRRSDHSGDKRRGK